jgi:putative transposase
VIGSIRRDCTNHLIVINDRHLLRILSSYKRYYNEARCHLSLGKDTPDGRDIHPPERGNVIAFPEVGGLHHRYERQAA